MGLNILELIVSPIRVVPVQGLFLTSTCASHLFSPYFFYSYSLALSPFTPFTMCLISELDGCEGSLPYSFPVSTCPLRSELMKRIKEGFEPSSLCTYYPLYFAILHLLTPTRLLYTVPALLFSISRAIIFLLSYLSFFSALYINASDPLHLVVYKSPYNPMCLCPIKSPCRVHLQSTAMIHVPHT